MGKIEMFGKKMLDKIVNWMLIDEFKEQLPVKEDFEEQKVDKRVSMLIDTTKIKRDEPIDLNEKIEDFLKEYRRDLIKDCNVTYVNTRVEEMKHLIDKMAVWYELRYSEEKLGRIFNYEVGEDNVDEIMFKYNPYVNDLLGEDTDAKEMEWDKFYNAEVFINSLPYAEKKLFAEPKCRDFISISPMLDITPGLRATVFINVAENGKVVGTDLISFATEGKIKNDELVGLTLKEVVDLFEERGFKLNNDSDLIKASNNYQRQVNRKNGMLDCVMYKLIERDDYSGSLRAYLFAKEFGRDKDIAIKYGVNIVADGSKELVNQYLNEGGKKDLTCYPLYPYFDKDKSVSLNELYSEPYFYNYQTEEEKELHQRLVNALATQLPPADELKKRILQARIARKLEKSKKNR